MTTNCYQYQILNYKIFLDDLYKKLVFLNRKTKIKGLYVTKACWDNDEDILKTLMYFFFYLLCYVTTNHHFIYCYFVLYFPVYLSFKFNWFLFHSSCICRSFLICYIFFSCCKIFKEFLKYSYFLETFTTEIIAFIQKFLYQQYKNIKKKNCH